MVMIGLVGGLAVAGLSVATGERSRKGDRLQVAPKHTSTVLLVARRLTRSEIKLLLFVSICDTSQ
jgi:hypothetical protein